MNITTIFTNWKRKDNLHSIIKDVKNQTLVPKIIVVDNASKDKQFCFETTDPSVTILPRDNSKMCWERWLTALECPNKYVCVMDDDLTFARLNVIQNCYNYMEENLKVDAIGAFGVKYANFLSYFGSEHTYCKHKDVPVSILKGRFMFVRFESIKDLNKDVEATCDDIKVSAALKNKILPGCLVNGFQDLPQGNESLSAKSYQSIKREYAAKRYFK